MGASKVEIDDVSKVYANGTAPVTVLDEVSLTVRAGEFLALMGPSGSGKSTLLNLIAGLDTATQGTVKVDGRELRGLSTTALAHWRASHVGLVFQSFNLVPILTAEQNVELPLLLTRVAGKERRRRVAAAIALVGLAQRARHRPRELSGGQEQRVAIARAIVTDPDLLLCDEPTGNLDRKTADEVLDLLGRLNREQGKTIVVVTHDSEAAMHAHTTLHLDKGRLRESAAA